MIARLHVGHIGTDFLDNARQIHAQARLATGKDKVLQQSEDRYDELPPPPSGLRLPAARVYHRHVFNDERLSHFMQYCGFHSSFPCSV